MSAAACAARPCLAASSQRLPAPSSRRDRTQRACRQQQAGRSEPAGRSLSRSGGGRLTARAEPRQQDGAPLQQQAAAASSMSGSSRSSSAISTSSGSSSMGVPTSLQFPGEPARDAAAAAGSAIVEQPPEIGVGPNVDLDSLAAAAECSGASSAAAAGSRSASREKPPRQRLAAATAATASAAAAAAVAGAATADAGVLYPQSERAAAWRSLMRWSKWFRSREANDGLRDKLEKVVVFGGGSFGTAMGVSLARQKKDVQVTLLLRDPYLCKDINELHCNTRYLKDFALPPNVNATTSAAEAIAGAQFAIHAVPVQHTRAFLEGIKDLLPPNLPIISVSKGIEVTTGQLMSEVIPSVLSKKHPTVYLSGPSFAKEVMMGRPTGIVAASKNKELARTVQRVFASPSMRVNTSTDVIGVEICGSLKNVLAIAAGIVEGLELGPNAMAALVAQGCSEIRWLATKMGAKPATISGLSGLGDIMLTCYGSLSRNRTVGLRLGQGEELADILASSSQVAEGVPTAAVVVNLARKYRVQLPVLTAVAQVLDGHMTAEQACYEIMNLPQIEER